MQIGPAPTRVPAAQRVQRVVEQWRQEHGLPGVAVSVREAGAPIVDVATGVSNVWKQTRLTTSDRMWVGSITKTAMAALTMRLVEQGAISLNDTVARWHPNFPRAEDISVRMLLDQTSGVPDPTNTPNSSYAQHFMRQPHQPWTREQMLSSIAERRGPTRPGAQFSYSNSNYILLGDILERVTGTRLDALAKRELGATIDVGVGVPAATVAGHAGPGGGTPYSNTTDLVGEKSFLRSTIGPAGGMVASAPELARLGESILWRGGTALTPASRAKMLGAADASPAGYGFGVVRNELKLGSHTTRTVYWHNGHLGSVGSAALLHIPDSEQTVSITLPSDPPKLDAGLPLFELASDVLFALADGE